MAFTMEHVFENREKRGNSRRRTMMVLDNSPAWLERLQGAPLPVLLTLRSRGRMDQRQLTRATGLKPQTVQQALYMLQTHGLVNALSGDRWVITAYGDAVIAQLQRRRAGQ
jgi:hypothetical protein